MESVNIYYNFLIELETVELGFISTNAFDEFIIHLISRLFEWTVKLTSLTDSRPRAIVQHSVRCAMTNASRMSWVSPQHNLHAWRDVTRPSAEKRGYRPTAYMLDLSYLIFVLVFFFYSLHIFEFTYFVFS